MRFGTRIAGAARIAGMTAVAAGAASPALAHTGLGDTTGFGHGFAHPFSGLDHVLAMGAVGVIAAQCGGRALWAVPLAFVATMAFGGALAMAGVNLPFVETGIALSVLVFGLAIATRLTPPVAVISALVALFALFHGHAHGAEMPDTASGFAYGLGFVAATAILHAIGLGLGLTVGRLDGPTGRRVVQGAGGAVALAGLALLVGIV